MRPRHLRVNEIFFSVQGESTHAGRPCAFVRLTGCPLRCSWCDTAYAFVEGQTRSFDDVFAELEKFGCNLIELTGGEPLSQPQAIDFLRESVERGYECLIETSGALPIEKVPPQVKIILDIKAPGSNEAHRMHWDNLGSLKPGLDEIKIVVKDRTDFDFAVEVERTRNLASKYTVLVSPVHGELEPKQLAEWLLESKAPLRMQVQLHKYLWGAETRGV